MLHPVGQQPDRLLAGPLEQPRQRNMEHFRRGNGICGCPIRSRLYGMALPEMPIVYVASEISLRRSPETAALRRLQDLQRDLRH